MTREETIISIIKSCQKYGLSADFVCAIAHVESNINHLAIRFEPKWKYLLDVEKFASKNFITKDTEATLQSMSYGPMQIMGTVCRELFFQGTLTTLVYDPGFTIDLSCKKIKLLFDKYGNEEDVIACWNGGNRKKYLIGGRLQYSNQQYVDRVLNVLADLKSSKIKLEGEIQNGKS